MWEQTRPYVPPVRGGQVIKVYDGDTITIATKLPGDDTLYRFPVRLAGVDCAEMHSGQEAITARDAVAGLLMGKSVELQNVGTEKYGRILADVYLGTLHVNTWLLENGYAMLYRP